MERLTNSIDYCKLHCDFGEIECCLFTDKTRCYEKSIFDKLRCYEELEEQGLLLRLPCKVGDTAYYLHREYLKNVDKWIDKIDEVEVDSFILNINLFVNVSLYIGTDVFRKTLTPYKTLFFTKAEAEEALAKMKGEKNERDIIQSKENR